jgi:hypothetical protein
VIERNTIVFLNLMIDFLFLCDAALTLTQRVDGRVSDDLALQRLMQKLQISRIDDL